MSDVKWIKIKVDIFDDEKILLIESLPASDSIIAIWFKLLCLAGKQNNGGVFMLNDKFAYTDEMLASIFRRPLATVKVALKAFEDFGMIERIEGVITIPNWNKHQSLDTYEKKLEYDRQYQAKRREKQREKVKSLENRTTNLTSVVVLDKEEDKEIDKDNISVINNTCVFDAKNKEIFDYWNSKNITVHRNMNEKLDKAITKAITYYGVDNIKTSIDNYNTVYKDSNYYFKQKWDLETFLKQSNALPDFLNEGKKWLDYINRKGNTQQMNVDKDFLKDFLGGN